MAYVPNALNQYASVGGTSVGGVTYLYDANANLEYDGANVYAFDSQSRLVSAIADNGAGGTLSASYSYDAFMRRVRKTVDGADTYYLWSDSTLIEEYAGNGEREVQYLYGFEFSPAHVRADDGSGTDELFDVHTNHLSTPVLGTDSSEGVVWRAGHAAFGQGSVDGASTLAFNVRFPGQYFDAEAGLHYNRYRYYDWHVGKFIQADPIGQRGSGVNLYRCVDNAPIVLIDPDGLALADWHGFPSADEHFRRNRNNVCPRQPPEGCRGWQKDPSLYGDKYRHESGYECSYDNEGRLLPDTVDAAGEQNCSYNYSGGTFNIFDVRHYWQDVLPHLVYDENDGFYPDGLTQTSDRCDECPVDGGE